MSEKYPLTITDELLSKNTHISNDQIRQDIKETEIEIHSLEKEIEGYRLIAEARRGQPDGKMAQFRSDGKRQGLLERKDFVIFLQKFLVARVITEGEKDER